MPDSKVVQLSLSHSIYTIYTFVLFLSLSLYLFVSRSFSYSFIILSQGTDPDLDKSGRVDMKDFAIFSQQWQQTCDDSNCADFDMSGLVDMTDLHTFMARWLDETL